MCNNYGYVYDGICNGYDNDNVM